MTSVLPRHIGVIMDGNGRWAENKGLPRREGHRAGAEAVRTIVTACRERSIACLTLYAFSKENWARPRQEVRFLFDLLVRFLARETQLLIEKEIRLRIIGDMEGLSSGVRASLAKACDATSEGHAMTLVLALNYSSRDEICRALRRIVLEKIPPMQIDEELLATFMDTAELPDPDLIIRTSGEMRLSNFLLYQSAYSELYFTPCLWPDFRAEHLDEALLAFARRERRFGKV